MNFFALINLLLVIFLQKLYVTIDQFTEKFTSWPVYRKQSCQWLYRCRYYIEKNNDILTRYDDVLETVNENADTNFNDMLYKNVQCATANDGNSGLYNAVEYVINDVIKNFMDECFIKDVIFGENSVYEDFYEEVSVNNHNTLGNNNSNDTCISKNANDAESTITYKEIMIHPNSNFDNITNASITAINEEGDINSITKVTILNDLIKECKSFLERVQKFDSNIEKRKHEPDKLDDETKLLEIREDGKWKKETTLIKEHSILSGLR